MGHARVRQELRRPVWPGGDLRGRAIPRRRDGGNGTTTRNKIQEADADGPRKNTTASNERLISQRASAHRSARSSGGSPAPFSFVFKAGRSTVRIAVQRTMTR